MAAVSASLRSGLNSAAKISKTSPRILTALLVALALVLSWLVFSRTLVAYLERIDPEWALAVRASDANAEFHLANDWLARTAQAEGGLRNSNLVAREQIKERILRALYAEPLNAWGFELLGILAATSEDTRAATAFMQAAAARSLRRPAASYWLLRQKLVENDIEGAIDHTDALLRTRPDLVSGITPALAQIAAMPGGAERLIATLATAPPWRKKFFNAVAAETTNVDMPAKLLLGLGKTDTPPAPDEVNPYLRNLIAGRNYELAYSSWLQLLPQQQLGAAGLLFNGSFEFRPSNLPFDWTIERSNGAFAEVVPLQGRTEKNALSLELGHGRVDLRPIYQFLLLAPGRYRLLGMSRGSLKGLRGLKWQIACVEQPSRALGDSQAFLDGSPTWTQFAVSFDVPAACRAQIIRLILDARSASETLVTGGFEFTGLKIERDAR